MLTSKLERSGHGGYYRCRKSSPHQHQKANCAVCCDPVVTHGAAITGQARVPRATPEIYQVRQRVGIGQFKVGTWQNFL